MADRASGFALQLVYLVTHLTLVNVMDIALVAGLLFVVLQALYRTRAQQLLRGASTFAILVLVLLLLLTLGTFRWLLLGLLLAGSVAFPLLFQDGLRRGLTSLGQVGARRALSAGERFRGAMVSACARLAASRESALIVLEGRAPRTETVASGIPLQAARATSACLRSRILGRHL